jgi:5'(3')-deoxyribonucleotidase
MSREIIAVDLDDVISSQTNVLIKFSNERYHTQLTQEDFKKPGEYWGYYERLWGVSEEEGTRRFKEFLDERYPLRQLVLPVTVKAIQKLKLAYDLEVITSRSLDYQEDTIQWIKEHIPGLFLNVHFVDLWSEGSKRATKAKICQEIGAGYLIDDNAEHCNLAAEVGVKALLFGEFGWNTHQPLHPEVSRVADWQAVLEYFDERG